MNYVQIRVLAVKDWDYAAFGYILSFHHERQVTLNGLSMFSLKNLLCGAVRQRSIIMVINMNCVSLTFSGGIAIISRGREHIVDVCTGRRVRNMIRRAIIICS